MPMPCRHADALRYFAALLFADSFAMLPLTLLPAFAICLPPPPLLFMPLLFRRFSPLFI